MNVEEAIRVLKCERHCQSSNKACETCHDPLGCVTKAEIGIAIDKAIETLEFMLTAEEYRAELVKNL